MNNISHKGIKAFIHVAEHGSFTSAAEASGLSKANLSQLVTDLERDLKVQLLHRTTRKLKLTELGEGYYRRSKQAMIAIDSANEWAMQSTDELSGVIRMNSVGGVFGEELIAPIILRFQQQFPDVQVQLDFSSIRVDLIDSQYDLVLRMGELPDSSLVAKRVSTVTTRYVASPIYIRQHPKITQPENLKEHTLIYGSVNNWLMKKGKEQRLINIDKGMRVISGRVMCQAAKQGLGITRLADVYCQSEIAHGRLVEILPDWAEQTPISLVCPPNRYQLNRVKRLMNWISEHFPEQYRYILENSS